MFTQCPECATVFPISADALSISAGNVRCGACGEVFFAVQSLSETLDEDGQIPTCFHSDHPPTLSDPGSDAPPIDDLFWPAVPSASPAGHGAEEDKPPESLPPVDMMDDEALEREFDRLINEADPDDAQAQPDTPVETAGAPAPQTAPVPGATAVSSPTPTDEAWIVHRYGPATGGNGSATEPRLDKPPPEQAGETPEETASEQAEEETGKTDSQRAAAAPGTDHRPPAADSVEVPAPPEAPADGALPEDLDPDGPLPDIFTQSTPAGEAGAELRDPSQQPEADAAPSGVAFELAADRAARNRTRGTWLWGLWSGFALMALLGQWFALEHDRLARNAAMRPWIIRACQVFDCRIELPTDLDRIQLTSRSIEPHPSVEGALLISATLQNQASFPQPHPVVEITMADLSGRAVAMRRFTPSEYLESPDPAGMIPGHLLPLVFEVIDPGRNAVAFEFTFR